MYLSIYVRERGMEGGRGGERGRERKGGKRESPLPAETLQRGHEERE